MHGRQAERILIWSVEELSADLPKHALWRIHRSVFYYGQPRQITHIEIDGRSQERALTDIAN